MVWQEVQERLGDRGTRDGLIKNDVSYDALLPRLDC